MSEFDADKLVDATAPAVELPIAVGHRPGVVLHLEAAHEAMQKLRGLTLDSHAEPAPVFRPDEQT